MMPSSSKNIATKINPVSAPYPSGSHAILGGYRTKICGMKYPENMLKIALLLPDYMGFIFWDKSTRYFTGEIPKLPASIKKVGVFVREDISVILAKAEKYNLQAIQLHGNESVAYCTTLKNELKGQEIEIIKVFSIKDTFDFQDIIPFEPLCHYFLFDTKGKLPGGNGETFDWQVLQKYNSKKPFFLSGGIGLDEVPLVKQILKTNLPLYALDLNSKFEVEPGLKDITLLQKLQHNLQL